MVNYQPAVTVSVPPTRHDAVGFSLFERMYEGMSVGTWSAGYSMSPRSRRMYQPGQSYMVRSKPFEKFTLGQVESMVFDGGTCTWTPSTGMSTRLTITVYGDRRLESWDPAAISIDIYLGRDGIWAESSVRPALISKRVMATLKRIDKVLGPIVVDALDRSLSTVGASKVVAGLMMMTVAE